MAIHKTEAFSLQDQELAAFAKALSHPARIAIMRVLARQEDCLCGQIVEVIPLAQATVSQHLKALKEAGLIRGTVEGPRSCYCIHWEAFEKFSGQFGELFQGLKANHQRCC
jgi:DNA-binding transcriptional ArsR family regulator